MKRKFKILTLPLVDARIFFLFAIIISIIIIFISNVILNIMPEDVLKVYHLDKNELIVLNKDVSSDGFTKIQQLGEVERNLHKQVTTQFKTKITNETKVSTKLQSSYSEYLNSNSKIYPIYYSDKIDLKTLNINSLGLDVIEVGNYPKTDNEILLGEYNALGFMQENDISDMSDILGNEITLEIEGEKYDFTISGVAMGVGDYYTAYGNRLFNEPLGYSYYKRFATEKQKKQYIKDNLDVNNEEYLSSENYNVQSYVQKINITTNIVITLVFILILLPSYIRIRKILTYYHKKWDRHLIYIIPICLIIMFMVIVLKVNQVPMY